MQRVIAVDWSGDKGPGQRKKIWAGVWTRCPGGKVAGGRISLEAGRTREELTAWLTELATETPEMAVSIDCCFSYPSWFLAEQGCDSVFDLWRKVAEGYGERWLGTTGNAANRDLRFWGKPHKRPACLSGVELHRGMRRTDMENKIEQKLPGGDVVRAALMHGITPKSPFQIGGSGSVGTGSLRAMPSLLRLRQAGFRVWPFESANLPSQPLLLEMYTRLLTGPVAKSNPAARRAYLLVRRRADALYAALPRSVLASAFASEDAFDALVCCLEMVRYHEQFIALTATNDPVLRLEGITWRPGIVSCRC